MFTTPVDGGRKQTEKRGAAERVQPGLELVPPSLYLVQSLLGLSSATGSVRAVVLKWALGRLQWLSQSHLFEP